ncbi:hypothetical protein LCI18_010710 [Fusarium solani-melongenae]|uniref:Uncharacterized protein n=1 Tax=Fusarium solani subsp. cucurbitae TaxID=2747967 RepID=A0ACD3ZF76_FUSSC|nr:hypothetical protein LCI18_010710 [Fusarium solani-melongenae]
MDSNQVSFLHLPQELAEHILDHLPLESIQSLRLVNRNVRELASGLRFHHFFTRQTTNLTPSSLSSIEALHRHELLGRHVRHLRVMVETLAIASTEHAQATGIYYPPECALRNRHGDCVVTQLDGPMQCTELQLKTLECSLEWMKSHGNSYDVPVSAEDEIVNRLASVFKWQQDSSLNTIELDARFVDGPGLFSGPTARHIEHPDRQRLWAWASRVYRLTMAALCQSGVKIRNLHIFSDTTGCSVPSYDITAGLPELLSVGLAGSLGLLKCVSLSFSTRMDHGWEQLEKVYGQKAGSRERRRQRLQWQQIWDDLEWQEMHGVATDDEEDTDDGDWDSDPEYDSGIPVEKGSEIRGRYGDTMPQVLCQDNFPGIALLLRHMPNLETLDLHMFQTLEYESYDGGCRLNKYSAVFKHVVELGCHFHLLKTLILRGLCIDPSDLLVFMERHSKLENLELRSATLSVSTRQTSWMTWNSVLSNLCRDAVRQGSALSRVFCSNLYVTPFWLRDPLHYQVNLLRRNEMPKEEWTERWWLRRRKPVQGRPFGSLMLSTREVLRDEFELDNVFGEVAEVPESDAQKNVNTGNFPSRQMTAFQENCYGRTYG